MASRNQDAVSAEQIHDVSADWAKRAASLSDGEIISGWHCLT
jgi:hypothetical protein